MNHMPLYIKVKEYILETIKSGNLKPGDKIPSEKKLSDLFNVSRITVSTAIRDLVNDGIVYRIQGKGTFISADKEENIENHYTFGFDNNNDELIKPCELITKEVSEIHSDKKLSLNLDMPIDSLIFKILQIKSIDNLVYSAKYIYLPANLYPSFNINNVKNSVVFDIVNEYCFLKRKKSKVHIKPIIISDKDALLLNVSKKIPVLLGEKKTYSQEGKIIEYSENIINTTINNFYIEF